MEIRCVMHALVMAVMTAARSRCSIKQAGLDKWFSSESAVTCGQMFFLAACIQALTHVFPAVRNPRLTGDSNRTCVSHMYQARQRRCRKIDETRNSCPVPDACKDLFPPEHLQAGSPTASSLNMYNTQVRVGRRGFSGHDSLCLQYSSNSEWAQWSLEKH